MALWGNRNARRERELVLAAPVACQAQAAPKRDKQLNLKVSAECKRVFADIQRVQALSAAALFEDMVAERAELLVKAGHLQL